MAVDGKNLRVGKVIFACFAVLLFLVFSQLCFAENAKQIQTIDLKNDICDITQMQVNTPALGIEFISEEKAVAFTVCVGKGHPKLAHRNEFDESSQYLRAAVFNVMTGQVEHRFSWPTHGDQSFVGVTKKGNLIVGRDNVLDTFDLDGKQLAHLQIERVKLQDPLLIAPSYGAGSVTVTEIAMTVSKVLLTATLVLDSDTLQPLYKWNARNATQDRVIVASPVMAGGWQEVQGEQGEKHVVFRKPGDPEWTTAWAGSTHSIRGPGFIDASRFVMATDHAVMIFNGKGEIESQVSLNDPSQFSVAKDGKHLVVASSESPASSAFLPSTRIDVFTDTFQRTATFTNFANQDHYFVLALSPTAKTLAILGNMKVRVYAITE